MSLNTTYPGLKVIDLATNFAGPYAAMILGDMGADVIKVERAPKGDDTRGLPPFAGDQATVFLTVNRNKRSIMLDYKDADDLAILHELVADADVVIESFPPGVAEKLGLTWEDLSALNPRLLLASVSAFGDKDIGKTMPGYDALVQAVSGLMSFTGNEGEPTVRIAPSALDLGTGIWAAMGVMAALARRTSKKDAGEHLKIALIDTAFNLMNHQLMAFQATGEQPRKLGAGAPSAAPYGVYRAADGEVLIATASEDQFPRLCDALELAEVKNDARFLTMIDRIAHRKEIDQLIAVAVENWTVDELMQRLSDARISAGRVNSVAEACSLPVVQERQLFATGGTPSDPAQLRLPLDPESTGIMRLPPRLDEHRAEILSELAQKRS
jgi:crotonobetainyl-CoA:carnitine CoA-transferase CaiB-like acyl-CoA transferase